MKIDRGEDLCFYIKFVYVFTSHLLHAKTMFQNNPCLPKYSITISQKGLDKIVKLELFFFFFLYKGFI